jgi:hypothetical protein
MVAGADDPGGRVCDVEGIQMSGLHVDEKIGVPLMTLMAAVVAFLFLTPAGFWFRVDRMDVLDAATAGQITIDYDRTIRRDFHGEWRATIRRQRDNGWEVVCSTDWTPNDYQIDAVLPEPVTLEWFLWTDPQCYQLGPGAYEASVTWVVNPGSWVFERKVRRTDGFLVYGAT